MSETKTFTHEELKELSGKKNLHLLIHGKVYAIKEFMDEHPGGDEVLIGEGGRDATEAFEDVGHSDEARAILKKYLVGEGPEGSPSKAEVKEAKGGAEDPSTNFTYLLPLAGLIAYLAYNYYQKNIAA